MKRYEYALAGIVVGLLLLSSVATPAATLDSVAGALVQVNSAAHVPFVVNAGQIDNTVRFYARLSSGALFVTTDGDLVYSLQASRPGQASGELVSSRWAFRESFSGRSPSRPTGAEPSSLHLSRFKGSRSEGWYSSLTSFERIDLGEVYPGIRATLRAAGNNVEKLLYVSPGASASMIQIAVEGVEALALDQQHRLVLKTSLGEIVFTAPEAYQTIDGERHPVGVSYTISDHTYGFQLNDYRPDREVVIDPLLHSTFIGGSNPSPPGNYDDDVIHAIVYAGDSIYIAGATQSPDFPIKMGYDETIGGNFPDGFVTRMSTDLSTVLASTFIGTEYSDSVRAMTRDALGRIVIAGQAGYGFPVTDGAYTHSGTTPAGGGFVSMFSPDLSQLVASAVVTPTGFPREVTLGNGAIYFGGSTNDPSFPITPGAYRSACCPPGGFGIRPYEGFAGRISTDLTTLEAMTYLGGVAVTGIAVAPDESVFISDGSDSATTGYLARFDADLTQRPAYLTYYPGSSSGSSRTYFNDVSVVDAESVITVGQTYMNDLPATQGAFDTSCGTDGSCDGVGPLLVPHADGFIGKYSYDLQTTRALTYLGGSNDESIRSVALGAAGTVIIAGETISTDFPTTSGAFGNGFNGGSSDAFIASLASDLSRLEYGSYLGGVDEDQVFAVALDGLGGAFVGGYTRSTDFPTTSGAFDGSYNGGTSDAFVSLFSDVDPLAASSTPGETCGQGLSQLWVDAYDAQTSTLTVSLASNCKTVDNNIYYGPLADVSSYAYSGEDCDVGMGPTANFTIPSGSYFFVIVGDDGAVEGSYGSNRAQAERPSSNRCGFLQDLSNSCSAP